MAEPGEIVDRLLAAYPHAAACPACRSYAAMIIKDHTSALGVAAVLGRHAAHHRVDPLALASGRFHPLTRDVLLADDAPDGPGGGSGRRPRKRSRGSMKWITRRRSPGRTRGISTRRAGSRPGP